MAEVVMPVKKEVAIQVLEDNMIVVTADDDEGKGTFCASSKQFHEVLRKKLAHPFAAERKPRATRKKTAE